MIIMGRREFRTNNGYRYQLDIDFDDAALMDDKLTADIKVREIDDRRGLVVEVPATLSYDLQNQKIDIAVDGEVIGTIDVAEGVEKLRDWALEPEQEGEMDEFLHSFLPDGIGRLEEILDTIPVPEPGIGCVIKAGLCSSLAQFLRCSQSLNPEHKFLRKARSMMACMGENMPGILSTAGRRLIKCWATLGLV